MKSYNINRYLTLAAICGWLACSACSKSGGSDVQKGGGTGGGTTTPPPHADDQPVADNTQSTVNITWDATATKVSHDVYYAEYGRVKRVNANTLLLTYHCGGQSDYWNNIALRRSDDNGKTWGSAQILMASNAAGYYGFSNPEILVMQNGWLMLSYVGRGNPDDNVHDNVQIRISKDAGLTWGAPQIVATGRSWEPGLVQLPDGDIEMFYSSEAKWWPSNSPQQDIELIHSTDNGTTWTAPLQVAYAANFRDGMPVPVLLNNNKGIAFAIESVNNSKSPWILWSSLDARWNYASNGTTGNNRRWLGTADNVFGGAPFLMQLTTGETLLSFQDADGRAISDWKKSTMLLYTGNSVANNFKRISNAWPNLPANEGAYYSSLFLKDAATVVMVTTRNFSDGHSEIWWKEGHITR